MHAWKINIAKNIIIICESMDTITLFFKDLSCMWDVLLIKLLFNLMFGSNRKDGILKDQVQTGPTNTFQLGSVDKF